MLLRAFLVVGALGVLALPTYGQQVSDTVAALQALQEGLQSGQITPDELRQRIEAAGLSLDDVREKLRQAGYPSGLLDQYLAGGVSGTGAAGFSSAQLEDVLRRLSIRPLDAQQISDSLRPDMQAFENLLSDTLAAARPRPPVFGRSLFSRASSQFTPVTTGPVPPNYQLGPGDELVLILTGDVQEIHTLPVTREGFIVIPNVGRVAVNGLTLQGLRNALYTYLGEAYSGVRLGPEATTFFEISIAALRRSQIFVVGEVQRPAQYEVTSVSTALDALYQAGGPGEQGSFRNIQVRRGERVIANLDIYEYLTSGFAKGDVTLNQGDVIFVPVRGRRVEISGNVVRPAIYELKGREGLGELFQLAGGIEPEADLRRVQIDRILPPEEREPGVQRALIDVDIAQLLDGEAEVIPLQPGDKVYVFAVSEMRRNTVTIRGNVWAPGIYGFTPGLTLAQLLERAGGLKPDAFLGRAQVVRLNPADLSRRVVPVALMGDDIELAEFDEIFVYSVAELQEKRYITIDGSVQNPGVYEFKEAMTIRDLVLIAGGLLDDAYLVEAEVARLSDRPDAPGEIAQIITVPIDSSYALTGTGGGGSDGGSNGSAASAPEFNLERYDKVFIRRKPGWVLQRTVVITGAVNFPGTYALERKDEGLANVVERAGGLTADAYPEAVRFFRREDVPGEPRLRLARVNVDLVKTLQRRSVRDDIILSDGDSIHIPEYIATVNVEGAVLLPNSVLFREGAGLGYYIEMAGGYAGDADKGRARVEFANGSVKTVSRFLFFKSSPEPGAGSRIFVPAKIPTKGINLGQFAAILGTVATTAILLTRK